MEYPIEVRKIDPSIEFYSEVVPLVKEAEDYLQRHSWCKEIRNGWLFINTGFALCIFLFDVETQNPDDGFTWVMVGDFPPMYSDTYSVPTTKDLLEFYIELANEWITNVESGKSIEDCYPFDASTDKHSVELFKRKLNSLKTIILPHIDELNFKNAIKQ
ncbi:MAG TPA: hypothetical protein VGE40_03135 [Bacilli bacterium]